jgi:hypothetical protein
MSSSTGSSSCTECGAGTSVNKQGSACEACNAGKYQHLSAQTACIRCAAGAFTPSHLTTGYTACKACEKGVYLCISACVRACVCVRAAYSLSITRLRFILEERCIIIFILARYLQVNGNRFLDSHRVWRVKKETIRKRKGLAHVGLVLLPPSPRRQPRPLALYAPKALAHGRTGCHPTPLSTPLPQKIQELRPVRHVLPAHLRRKERGRVLIARLTP